MKIVHIASEASPFAKTGGLADVTGALPAALAALGDDVTVIMPFYGRMMETRGFGAEPIPPPAGEIEVQLAGRRLKARLLKTKLPGGVTVYFISEPSLYDRENLYGTAAGDYPDNASRFIFFSRAAIEVMIALGVKPEIVHVHDWQAALVPVYLSTLYNNLKAFARTKTALTIHNLGYQGLFPREKMVKTGLGWKHFTFDQLEYWGQIGFLKGGIAFSDAITTVSPKYAQEILTPEQGMGLEAALDFRKSDLTGILNGIDYGVWDPAKDELIPAQFGPRSMKGKAECKEAMRLKLKLPMRKGVPVIGMVGRLTSQKGLDIFEEALPELMKRDLQFAILGTGEQRYHKLLKRSAAEYPDRIGLEIAFDEEDAHLIEAGSDLFLMPSRYEPCGLNQMISLKYGTIPIVRATGGLDDSIEQFDPRTRRGTGFKFVGYTPEALIAAVDLALEVYKVAPEMKALRQNAMKCDFSCSRSAKEYRKLYRNILKKH